MADFNNKAEIDRVYAQLSPRADLVYSFVTVYNSYINELRDYGTGLMINMVEVHTLTMIADNPGITVNELSKMWNRTKGAVSQNVAKLEKKGLISLDYDKPLKGFDEPAYAGYPIRGSLALTERGQKVLELLEYQGYQQS